MSLAQYPEDLQDMIKDFTKDITLRNLFVDFIDSFTPPNKLNKYLIKCNLSKLLRESDTNYESKIILLYSLTRGYTILYSYTSIFPKVKLDLEYMLYEIEGGNIDE